MVLRGVNKHRGQKTGTTDFSTVTVIRFNFHIPPPLEMYNLLLAYL